MSPLLFYEPNIFLTSVISYGQTALICSSWNGRLDITRFLVESGANLEAKDNMYFTPKTCSSVEFF